MTMILPGSPFVIFEKKTIAVMGLVPIWIFLGLKLAYIAAMLFDVLIGMWYFIYFLAYFHLLRVLDCVSRTNKVTSPLLAWWLSQGSWVKPSTLFFRGVTMKTSDMIFHIFLYSLAYLKLLGSSSVKGVPEKLRLCHGQTTKCVEIDILICVVNSFLLILVSVFPLLAARTICRLLLMTK